MHHFVPRPFPPPALANVPVEYIVDQLHSLAPNYWSKPETADCTLVIPLDSLYYTQSEQASQLGLPPQLAGQFLPNSLGSEQSGSRPIPRMVMKLHIDYLSSQSTLLRGMFSGASPVDLRARAPVTLPMGSMDDHSPKFDSKPTPAYQLPPFKFSRLPRFMPSTATHPIILLPVPDPSSLRLLVHYMYFGSIAYLEDALDRGEISWEGLARNVEYLGMGLDIKVFLGRWYGQWRHERDTAFGDDDEDMEDYDSDEESEFDSDFEDRMEFFDVRSQTTATTVNLSPEDEMELDEDFKTMELPPPRGRDRTTRRLGHATSAPILHRGRPPARLADLSRCSRGRSE